VLVRKRLPHMGELLEHPVLEQSVIFHICEIIFEYILGQGFLRLHENVRTSPTHRYAMDAGSPLIRRKCRGSADPAGAPG